MKKLIKQIINSLGYELRKVQTTATSHGLDKSPIGRMDCFLEDIKKRGLNCITIMDVGANRTNWSRMAKRIYPDANFCLIEPQIEMEDNLKVFCEEFKGSVYYLNGAGAKKEVLTLTIWDDLAGSSFLPKEEDKLLSSGKQRQIEMIKIDDLIENKEIKLPEIIKLDIQGFELEALKGAVKTFGYTEVYILEVSLFSFSDVPGMPIISDVIDFMLEHDYVVYDVAGFLRRPLDGALAQCDICFVKKNGFFRKYNDFQ